MGEQTPQLFRAKRGKHSKKPDIVYDEIARLYPNLTKLGMVAGLERSPAWVAYLGQRGQSDDAA